MEAYVLGPGEGTALHNPITSVVLKLRGSQCGDATNVFEIDASPGEGPPLHFHQEQDEWLYVLDGSFRFRLRDELTLAPAGTFVFLPRTVAHTWQNVSEQRGRLLGAFVPPALERFFERFAALPREDVTPDVFRAIAEDDGMVVVGPPLAQSHPAT